LIAALITLCERVDHGSTSFSGSSGIAERYSNCLIRQHPLNSIAALARKRLQQSRVLQARLNTSGRKQALSVRRP
jgi:hypothetical protein